MGERKASRREIGSFPTHSLMFRQAFINFLLGQRASPFSKVNRAY